MGSENPYSPVHLPEFGCSISWAMCRNALCPNFGIHYSGGPPDGARHVSDDRLQIDVKAGRVKCRSCELSFTLNSNRAIREAARLFLSWSLPFADCPNPDCANHGINLFENHAPGVRPSRRPYKREGAGRARCGLCGTQFRLGTPLRVHGARGKSAARTRAVMERVISGAMNDRSVGRTLRAARIDEDVYYAHLRCAGDRLRDYLSWRNAALLGPRFADWEGPVRVFTDSMVVSLWRWGDAARHVSLHVPVTVVDLRRDQTYYILAAHPAFLPLGVRERDDLFTQVMRGAGRVPSHDSPWDWLDHPMRVNPRLSADRQFKALPDIGLHGLYLNTQYAELAHFLVVRKLLSRFPKVYHYMDGAKSQMGAALTALADEVRAGRWEIALEQDVGRTEKPDLPRIDWPKKEPQKKLVACLTEQWQELEGRWEEKRRESAGELVAPDAGLDARLLRSAFKGAFSETGEWAWLRHPPPGQNFKGGRSLWLTRRPDSCYKGVGRDLLWAASTLPVDRVHSHLRDDVRAFERAAFRATPGRSYRDASKDPRAVTAELWLALLERDFGPRRRKGTGAARAEAMGLAGKSERYVDLGKEAWEFRLGISHAERISEWLAK